MMYAVLCYHDEATVSAWSPEEEAKVVGDLIAVHDKWGKTFRPVLRLMPTGTATSVSRCDGRRWSQSSTPRSPV